MVDLDKCQEKVKGNTCCQYILMSGVGNPASPLSYTWPSSDFCPACHLTLDWCYIILQLTQSVMNLWNINFSLNPLLTSTRNIFCQVEDIKTFWLMQNWCYHYFGSTYAFEQLFFKMKYTKSHLRSRLCDDHLDNVFLLSLTNISPDVDKLLHNKRKQVFR